MDEIIFVFCDGKGMVLQTTYCVISREITM